MVNITTPNINRRLVAYICSGITLLTCILMAYWSIEPAAINVRANARSMATEMKVKPVTGFTTVATLIKTTSMLLEKPGGFLENDMLPPGILMDNMPNFEFGALEISRLTTNALRYDLSRSRSNSVEDPDLVRAATKIHNDSETWIMPAPEGKYRASIADLKRYLKKLTLSNKQGAQFYARADNLRVILKAYNKRLGSMSKRLGAARGKDQINTDLAGDKNAKQSTPTAQIDFVQTGWWDIDDVFYQTRGQVWAMVAIMKALQIDFAEVLKDKNAEVSFAQIINELQGTQLPIWAPMIFNGGNYGFLANHSLTMASYLSRANSAMIELERLLARG